MLHQSNEKSPKPVENMSKAGARVVATNASDSEIVKYVLWTSPLWIWASSCSMIARKESLSLVEVLSDE